MSASPPASDMQGSSTADPSGVERQRAKLDRLGDLALELAEILVAKARDATGEVDLERIALAVARVSRVVRLTCALHARLAQTLQAIGKDQISLDNAQAYKTSLGRTDQIVARKRIITRVLARVAIGDESLEDHEALEGVRECCERLEDDTVLDLLKQPVSEIIDELCRSLGLAPDWEALATEAWAKTEIEGGKVGSPLAAIAARMIDRPPARRPRPAPPIARPRAAPAIAAVRAASP